jgi:hypothetical protein
VDHGYQRDPIAAKLAYFTKHWEWGLCGPLTVSRRVGGVQAGELFILDGQHRYRGAITLFGPEVVMNATIEPLTYEEEALAFARQHDHETRVTGYPRYRALLEGQDVHAWAVETILKHHGWKIAAHRGSRVREVRAVHALMTIYNQGAGAVLLDRTLGIITAAYPFEPDAYQGQILLGLAGFLERYPDVDDEELIARLSRPEGLPREIFRFAARYGPVSGKGKVPVARAILDVWNKGRRVHRREWTGVVVGVVYE